MPTITFLECADTDTGHYRVAQPSQAGLNVGVPQSDRGQTPHV